MTVSKLNVVLYCSVSACRCLVDVRWWKQWKKYVGYDQWDQSQHGLEEAHPGPVDNTNLFNKKKPIKGS